MNDHDTPLDSYGNAMNARHDRLKQVHRSLVGLSIGDGLGRIMFMRPQRLWRREVPDGVWNYTDDTRMALAIAHILAEHGFIDQDDLAMRFARDFEAEPGRGYGAVAHFILHQIASGTHWEQASTLVYSGTGSKGNGGAMRASVVGAYFCDDLDRVVEQAVKAARVTHAHPEGQAGAVAVAVAGALAVRFADEPQTPERLFEQVIEQTPRSEVRLGLEEAARMLDMSASEVGQELGTGVQILAEDTVPFAIWCAFKAMSNYEEALWMTFEGLPGADSDVDTLGAIVGGIVSLSAYHTISPLWCERVEAVPGLSAFV